MLIVRHLAEFETYSHVPFGVAIYSWKNEKMEYQFDDKKWSPIVSFYVIGG